MTQKTIQQLKYLLQRYQYRKKMINTVHIHKQQHISQAKTNKNHETSQKLSLSISSPFYKKQNRNIPRHIHVKKNLTPKLTHQSYLRKGDGDNIFLKRKIISQIKKDINSRSPQKNIQRYKKQVKNPIKRQKQLNQIYKLFKIKCDYSKPKLDCFNYEFQQFLRKNDLKILRGLQEIQNRLMINKDDRDNIIRKDLVQFIQQQVSKKSQNIEKNIKNRLQKIIKNKNKAKMYFQWGIQVSKVIKKYIRLKNNQQYHSLDGKNIYYNKQNKINYSLKDHKLKRQNKQSFKRKLKKKKNLFSNSLIFSDKQYTQNTTGFQNQNKSKVLQIEKKNIRQQDVQDESIEKKKYIDQTLLKRRKNNEKKIKAGSLIKKSLLQNKIRKLLNGEQQQGSIVVQQKNMYKTTNKTIKKANLKKYRFTQYLPKNYFVKEQIQDQKDHIQKSQRFIQKVQNYLIKNKMKDYIIQKDDSELTLKRKSSNLINFAFKEKKAKKIIKKYLKINSRQHRQSNQNNNFVGFEDTNNLNTYNLDSTFYFYDLWQTNYHHNQNDHLRQNQKDSSTFTNIPSFTSNKVKKSQVQYFQDYLINNQIKDKKEKLQSIQLLQKNLQNKTQLKVIFHRQSHTNQQIIENIQNSSKKKIQILKTPIIKNIQNFRHKLKNNF